ncbi:hydantoinase/oxoprolinase family protein [Mesorhizobium sp. KR9-304]|uniref:hydantoinase/oxoprolinase family protein n=1 Tax=Mesorhizobium sp. KR9-304 TaxID=3156614 RepID=UPI0032B5E6CA
MSRTVRIGVDVGGTFTDFVMLVGDGSTVALKIASTPIQPELAVIEGIRTLLAQAAIGPASVSEILHGTTVGSNTLLQKTGARCGLITTAGFRDVLEIGRVRTPTMFDLSWRKPEPLVPRRWRIEVKERIAADGSVLEPLDTGEILEAGRLLVGQGIDSIAICFLNSYVNPAHEQAAARVLATAFPGLPVTASVDVLPSMGEYERCSTTVVNAYVVPTLRGYLKRLEQELRAIGLDAPLLIGNSNGGLSTAAVAQAKPVFFVTSGRASGAVGAARLGMSIGCADLIAFDMGGTTASATMVRGGDVSRTHEYEFRDGISTPSRFIKAGGYMMRVPTVDVAEVGSGAGSIASLDEGGLLRVGPVSAGALPGPACYGLGGDRPTVTDANVALGLLPTKLGGGSLQLDPEAARTAIARHIAEPGRLTVDDAAQGIRDLVNANMARAIRAVTVERGLDPRDFMLLAFGGSGPVHACDVATTLGMKRVLFPATPGVFTAAGMLASRLEHHFLRSFAHYLDRLDIQALISTRREMEDDARKAFATEGHAAAALDFAFSLDMRFQGQEASLPVPLPVAPEAAALRGAFLNAYRETYGYASDDRVEIVAVRLAATRGDGQVLDFSSLRRPRLAGGAGRQTRRAFFGREQGWIDAPVLKRAGLDASTIGPLIVESDDCTIVIPVGATADTDGTGNLLVTLA